MKLNDANIEVVPVGWTSGPSKLIKTDVLPFPRHLPMLVSGVALRVENGGFGGGWQAVAVR